jgi:hypothetical protein
MYVNILLNFKNKFLVTSKYSILLHFEMYQRPSSETSNIKYRTKSCHCLFFVVILIFLRSLHFTGTYSHKRNRYLHQGKGLHRITARCSILFEKLTVTQLAKKYPAFFMEPEGLLPCSQKPTTGPHPQPADSISSHGFLSPERIS